MCWPLACLNTFKLNLKFHLNSKEAQSCHSHYPQACKWFWNCSSFLAKLESMQCIEIPIRDAEVNAHIYKLVPPVLCSFSPSFLCTTIFFVICSLSSNVIPTMHLKIGLSWGSFHKDSKNAKYVLKILLVQQNFGTLLQYICFKINFLLFWSD